MGALISDQYRAVMAEMHESIAQFGTHDIHYAPTAREMTEWGEKSLLSYGAGKGALARRLGPQYAVTNYDPGVPGMAARPEPHDVVMCLDVMEHVEPDCVDAVLADIRRCAREKAVIAVHTCAAIKFLPDGRNTHLTQRPPEWWRERVEAAGFTVEHEHRAEKEVMLICK